MVFMSHTKRTQKSDAQSDASLKPKPKVGHRWSIRSGNDKESINCSLRAAAPLISARGVGVGRAL
jgi:hypothetical protein